MKKLDPSDRVIYTFEVWYNGWESDNKAWIMQNKKGGTYCVMTSHGTPYVSSKKALDDQIKRYKQVLANTIHARNMLDQ